MLEFIKTFFLNNWLSIIVGVICLFLGAAVAVLFYRSKRKPKEESKKRSLFSKIAIFVVFFIMTIFALFSFFGYDRGFAISNGIVYILGLMIFLLISDSIETFSIGNLITLNKKVKDKEKEVEKLSVENNELRTQIVSIAAASITNTNNSNNQMNVNFGEALRGVSVESAIEGDREEAYTNHEAEEPATPPKNAENQNGFSGYERSFFVRMVEKRIIEKFALKNDIDTQLIQMGVKFSEQFTYGDPIMESKTVFSAYLKRPLDELFIETIHLSASVIMNFRLYYMISMVVHYAQINNKSAKLVLLIPNYPNEWAEKLFPYRNPQRDLERLQNTFQPAIKNGFLEIKVMEFNETECQEIESKIKTESK